jgi:hypothetical protein
MASPVIRGQTAPAAGGTVTSPAGTQVGDLVIVYTFERSGASIGATTLSVNSGANFNTIRNHHHDDGTTDGSLACAWKIATQVGQQSYQGFTSSTGSPVWWTGCTVLQVGTFDTATILATSLTQTTNAIPNPATISGLTAAREYLVVAVAAWHLGSSLTNAATAPSSYTNLVQLAGAATGDLAIASRAVTGVTSEDPGTFGDDQAPSGTATITFAIASAIVTGTLAVTGSTDTASLAGDVFVAGTMAVTGAVDTASLAGDVFIAGTSAVTDATDTAAVAGDVIVQGSSTVTDAGDTCAAAGEVTTSGVAGDLAVTDTADSASASGQVLVQGTLSPSGAVDVLGASGGVLVSGGLTVSDAGDSASVAGDVFVTGTITITDTGDGLVASGDVIVSGTLISQDATDTAVFSAGTITIGNLEVTEASPDTVSVVGDVIISGTWVSTDGSDTAAALGSGEEAAVETIHLRGLYAGSLNLVGASSSILYLRGLVSPSINLRGVEDGVGYTANISDSDNWSAGEGKSLVFTIYQSGNVLPQDVTGWALSWTLTTKSGSLQITKTTANGGITLTAPASGVITVSVPRADTLTLSANTYLHELWRTDTGFESKLSSGIVVIES